MVFSGNMHEVCLEYADWFNESKETLNGSLKYDIDFPYPDYNLSNVELTVEYRTREDS